MCGICGVFTYDRLVTNYYPTIPIMIQLMIRRGPDDEGFWSDQQHVAFGFRRLAIIDPTPAGNQPMVSPSQRHVIVFNGELYNFRELRSQLESKGITFRSESDTEVVLQAIAFWGEAAFAKFNGMFALAWYDIQTRVLLLARDPMGIKPLYYLLHPQGLVFGSQYDQILCHPFCDRSKARMDVLSLYLRLGYIPAPYGILENTYQLEPGRYLKITPHSGAVINMYYYLPKTEGSYLTDTEAVEAVESVILRSVKRQMVSDVPIGTFLSGGVDSPLVAAAMQKASENQVPAFTIGSTDPRFDESGVAREYAQHLGVNHYLRIFSGRDCLALIDKVVEAYSEPFADYSSFPSILLSSFTREKVKVALSGDGGDELFWGYPRFIKVLKARNYFKYPSFARFIIYAACKYLGLTRPPRGILFDTIGNWYFDSHSGLRNSDLINLCPDALRIAEDFTLFELSEIPNEIELAKWLRLNEISGHLQMILLKMDRASMYFGLEVRVPLLDLEIVEQAVRIPPSECMRNGVGKIILRKVFSHYVPEKTIPIRKSGFDVPLGDWLRKELRPYIEEFLLTRESFPDGVFHRHNLRSFYKEHVDGRIDRTQGLWNLLSLQLWAHKHLRQQSCVLPHLPPEIPHMNRDVAMARH